MKKLHFLILFFVPILSYSQIELPVEFEANQNYRYELGKEFDRNIEQISNTMNVMFDGDRLVLTYKNGKEFLNKEVVEFYQREIKGYNGDITSHALILEILDNELSNYYVIEKTYRFGGAMKIRIPFITESGYVFSYNIFSKQD